MHRSTPADSSVEAGDRVPCIVAPGRNCLAAPLAHRAAVLVDGAAYFANLETCLSKATRTIFIVGWDFDASISLRPGPDAKSLGAFLRSLVEAQPQLELRVLVWSMAVAHAPGASTPLLFGAQWEKHPRISVKLDRYHPLYAAHHQKIVCIDDEIAFVGGMDLTVGRWDEPEHLAHDERRTNPDGKRYRPVHDVQAVVQGPAAGMLASVARDRWLRATGERVAPTEAGGDLWPRDLAPDFQAVPVAISRTSPAWRGETGIRECTDLTLDALRAARRAIFIETQYFSSDAIGDLLCEVIARPDGPEVVVIVNLNARGPMEHFIMGRNRDRLARRIASTDRFGRFRIYYVAVPSDDGLLDVKLHSKLLVVDDCFLRVGSSNLNNRSLGLDTECDVGIEGSDTRARAAILRIRNRLLCEHLAAGLEDFESTLSERGSLIAAIDRFKGGARTLRELPALSRKGPSRPVLGTGILDPSQPFAFAWRRQAARCRSLVT